MIPLTEQRLRRLGEWALRHGNGRMDKKGNGHGARQPQLDETLRQFLTHRSIPLLRWSLGIVYIWFGLLKLAGVSPAAEMVIKALAPVPARISVPLMGAWETLIGVGLITRTALFVILPLFFLQIVGTFTLFIRRPCEAFQGGNPLLLTKEGEFMLKNLVLLAAGLVVATRAAERDEEMDG